MPGVEGPYRFMPGQQNTVTINYNDVPKAISFGRATHAPSENTIAGRDDDRNAFEGGEQSAILNIKRTRAK